MKFLMPAKANKQKNEFYGTKCRKIERNNIKVKITNYQDIIFILFIFKIHTNRPCTKTNIF